MSRCEYNYYVTLLPCNQFHYGGPRGPEFSQGVATWPPLTTATASTSSPHSPSPPTAPSNFSSFRPASESEISKILFKCPNKQSDSYPIPTWLLNACAQVLTPTITNIVNLSISSGQFQPVLKESAISPLLKYKPTLDKDQLSNYRPISNLSLISKIIKRGKMSTYWSSCFQWSSQSSSVCLLQASLQWNSPTVYPWSSHQWQWITEVKSKKVKVKHLI